MGTPGRSLVPFATGAGVESVATCSASPPVFGRLRRRAPSSALLEAPLQQSDLTRLRELPDRPVGCGEAEISRVRVSITSEI